MKLKKVIYLILALLLIFINENNVYANDNFIDNNASSIILKNNENSNLIISEFNTGKIIAKNKENEKYSYKNIASKIATFVISENIKNKNITTKDSIELLENENYLKDLKIENSINVKDLIFLLENNPSNNLINSTFKKFNITESTIQNILDKLTLRDTEINDISLSDNNKTTAKNINYLTEVTIKNYPEITDITKEPKFTLSTGEEVENNIKFIPSETMRTLGINYFDKYSTTVTYSGNTKFIITILNIDENKEKFFETLEEVNKYLFNNYEYKLALKAGTYDINNENITIKNDIYDLFFKNHSEKDIKYFLMNGKILFFQNYNYLSANSGTVFSEYLSNENKSNTEKIKETFIQDIKFDEKSKVDKINILIDRTQYFASIVLLIYSSIFLVLYIIKKPFSKGD
ncbi:hypothetical protein [Gemelliphila palaticanis]|uniref:Uncharacterized protein n=1 Tax=Gemelliphila palaticanis TaxID=81950 RepID=A0ABX2SZP1_9BACL|nr:hypothetical protein [Gemella palaticanis]MBF0714714.1 hypothetical protein [Gemella palaticanis]NYS46644.1 hypothetical protein [Gemella palaticanis]